MSFCKIRLSIPGKSLAITMPPEEAEVWFATLTSALLDAPQPEDEPETEPEAEPEDQTEAEPEDKLETAPEAMRYKGFLLLRCEHCGAVKGWNAKTPTCYHRCTECKGETELKDLHNMRAKCGFCGRVWSYKTNLTDRLAETNCVACGAPITMERDKNGNYDSVGGTY